MVETVKHSVLVKDLFSLILVNLMASELKYLAIFFLNGHCLTDTYWSQIPELAIFRT